MPSEKQYLERKENISAILQYIRANGPKSRRQISTDLDLSWGCVSELVSILLLRNVLLEEEVKEPKSKGRVPAVLRLNPDIRFLGVDINKMGLKACVCDLLGEKIAQFSGELKYDSKDSFIASILEFINIVLQEQKNIFGIGFAMQGIFDAEKDCWEFPAESVISINFSEVFAGRLDVPFVVEHDPECILYGCLKKTAESQMIVRLDKGIGAAIYKNKAFLKNELLEIGYLVVNEKGERLHDIASLLRVNELLQRHANDDEMKYFFENVGRHLGVALGNICNLFTIDEIYVCGDMVAYFDLFSEKMTECFEATVLSKQSVKISAIKVTDAAFGAAKMAMEKFPR